MLTFKPRCPLCTTELGLVQRPEGILTSGMTRCPSCGNQVSLRVSPTDNRLCASMVTLPVNSQNPGEAWFSPVTEPQLALDPEFVERFNDLMASGKMVAAFAAGLKHPDPKIRSTMATNLGYTEDGQAVEFLIEALKDDDNDVRWSAAMSLERLADSGAVAPLVLALEDEDRHVRRAAAQALKSIGGPEAERALRQMQNEAP